MKKNDKSLLKNNIIKGTSLLLIREFMIKVVAIIGQIFLVRILLPDYFGIFAILTFIISIAELFTDVGLSQAIIQKKNVGVNQLSTIFYVKLTLSILIVIVVYLLAPFIPMLFKSFSNEHILMTRIMVLILLIKPINTICIALLEKNLNYGAVSVIDLGGIICYYFFSFIFAIKGFQVWSFILALAIKEFVETAISMHYSKWTPSLHINIKEIKSLINFGKYIQAGSIFYFFHSSMIPLIAGTFSTPYVVGLLDWSYNVASLPRSLSDNFGRIAFSSFSKIQDDKKMISKIIEKSFNFLNVISLLFIIVIFGFGNEIVHFILTDKWLPALPALYWFSASVIFFNGTASLGHAILSIGKSKEAFRMGLVLIPFEGLLSAIFLLLFGVEGMAMGAFLSVAAMFAVLYVYAKKYGFVINISHAVFPIFKICACSGVTIMLLNTFLHGTLLSVVYKVGIFCLVYVFLSFKFYPKESSEMLMFIKKATA